MSGENGQHVNRAINGGLAANALLAALKTGIGIVGHSEALLADGINSTSDVAYYVVVKVCMSLAGRPADREHPYGHRQLETIAALAVGAFVITTAIALFWDAINSVYDVLRAKETPPVVSQAALWVALLTVVAKIGLTVYTRRVALQSANVAILALARDHRNDVFCAAGAAVGIVLSRAGLRWGDPLVGAVVAMVILCTGMQILRESAADLMDTVPGEALERQARQVLSHVPGVAAMEELQAHRFGPYLVLHVTVGVDGRISVADGDRIASAVERELTAHIRLVRRVHVHYHPARTAPGRAGHEATAPGKVGPDRGG